MITASITLSGYTVLLALHIACAVLWVGGGFTMHAFGRIAQKSGDRVRMNQFAIDAAFIGPRFYAPLSILLLVFGSFLVDKAGYEMSATWVGIGWAGWIISFLIGILYYSRADKRRAQIVETDSIGSDAFLASYRQVQRVNTIELTILLLVVLDMAIKPT